MIEASGADEEANILQQGDASFINTWNGDEISKNKGSDKVVYNIYIHTDSDTKPLNNLNICCTLLRLAA